MIGCPKQAVVTALSLLQPSRRLLEQPSPDPQTKAAPTGGYKGMFGLPGNPRIAVQAGLTAPGPPERSIPMKWQWSLMLATLLASSALAQATPPPPIFAAGQSAPCCPDLFNNSAGAGRDRFSGNHNFVTSINWITDPLPHLHPRTET